MSKIMKTTPVKALFEHMFGEYLAKKTIFEIPAFCIDAMKVLVQKSPRFAVHNTNISIPVGLAAGPHTQIAPNLIAGWLCGARVFELKTVQVQDRLEIEKPCIDALDEGHNVEWSTELLVEEAMEEYLRGWIAIKTLAILMDLPADDFIFNISAGYTLEGIKSKKIDAFIEGMRNPWKLPVMQTIITETVEALNSPACKALFGEHIREQAQAYITNLSDSPVHSITLSTMHGCPSHEIEQIGAYLIKEKKIPTYIKLNPTLLGYLKVRSILNKLGWTNIELKRETFEHDLQFEDALMLIGNLSQLADNEGTWFGVKLSNTLANINNTNRLPGAERYMSGRALFPITIRLASELVDEIPTLNALSFCGGVAAYNAKHCIEAGLGPLTAVTDILKPGGYQRIFTIAEQAVAGLEEEHASRPDSERLHLLADSVFNKPYYQRSYKTGTVHIDKQLPLTDCFAAPCIEACPAMQKAPPYIRALADQKPDLGLEIIFKDNPLPNITGILCDHQCMYACSRNDYEGPIEIREIKLRCALTAHSKPKTKVPVLNKGKTAILGSGPAGLACAHYLALNGYPVTVFEQTSCIGGIPASVIPKFRITKESLQKDIERIQALGVTFISNANPTYNELKQQGFTSIVLASGTAISKPIDIKNCTIPIITALDLLKTLHLEREKTRSFMEQYQHANTIIVIGGGNTAMDAARIASRLPWRPDVYIAYRRTKEEMPADKEELEAAFADGVKLLELSLPEAVIQKERPYIVIRKMLLGKPGDDGRRVPYPSDITELKPCDLIISAIGETADTSLLDQFNVTHERGYPLCNPETMMSLSNSEVFVIGDLRRGPSSIIAAEADGKKAAFAILRTAGIEPVDSLTDTPQNNPKLDTIRMKRGTYQPKIDPRNKNFITNEAQRCLSCEVACLRCVETCPNRANVAMPIPVMSGGPFKQPLQIIHIDALCNECGNCSFFCPYNGEPCKDKITLFDSQQELETGSNAGFAFTGNATEPTLILRTEQKAKPLVLSYETWTTTSDAQAAPLLLAARELFTKHRYLLARTELYNKEQHR